MYNRTFFGTSTVAMATIYIRHNSPYWWARFSVPVGNGTKEIRLSTKIPHSPKFVSGKTKNDAEKIGYKTSDLTKASAMRRAKKLAEALQASARANLPAIQIRKAINKLASDFSTETTIVPSCGDWLNQHLVRVARSGLRPASVSNYKQAFDKFKMAVGKKIDLPIDRVTPLMAESVRDYILTQVSPNTARLAIRLISSAFAQAAEYQLINKNPFAVIGKLKTQKPVARRRKFEPAELKLVMNHANPEWQSMVLTCLYTGGQRLGDIATLRWDQIDFVRETVTIETQKTSRLLVIPMIPALKTHLEHRRKIISGSYVHPECADLFNRSGSGRVSGVFGRILYQCGLIEKDPLTAGKKYKTMPTNAVGNHRHVNALSFHSLRYTAVTMLHDAGVPPALVKTIVGHSSDAVHSGYIDFGQSEIKTALQNLAL